MGWSRLKSDEMAKSADKIQEEKKKKAISDHLKSAYDDVVNEPLPEAFHDLLKQLDEKSESSSSKK